MVDQTIHYGCPAKGGKKMNGMLMELKSGKMHHL